MPIPESSQSNSVFSQVVFPGSNLSDFAAMPEVCTHFGSEPEALFSWLEAALHHRTGQSLSDLQRIILRLCLKGKRYLEIAEAYGCTEGHAKDVGAKLWRSLSQTLGEKITKQNLRATAARYLNRARALKARALATSQQGFPAQPSPSSALRLDPAAHQLFRWSWDDQADPL